MKACVPALARCAVRMLIANIIEVRRVKRMIWMDLALILAHLRFSCSCRADLRLVNISRALMGQPCDVISVS